MHAKHMLGVFLHKKSPNGGLGWLKIIANHAFSKF